MEHPLMAKVKEQIDDMLEKDIIFPVTEPHNWCSGMVVVPKPNGKVRICVDYTQLNKVVKREIHPMHSVDESRTACVFMHAYTHNQGKSRVEAQRGSSTASQEPKVPWSHS